MITNQEEYTLPSGETITIQLNRKIWEVVCWSEKSECRWYREFENEESAKKEFEKWR